MQWVPRRGLPWIAALPLLAMGCPQAQKPLKHEQSKTVESKGTWAVSLDPLPRETKVKAVVVSAGTPVDIFVILEGDPNKAKDLGSQSLLEKKPIAGALATEEKTENATLEATIPANKGFSLVVNNPSESKNAEVKLTVTSQ